MSGNEVIEVESDPEDDVQIMFEASAPPRRRTIAGQPVVQGFNHTRAVINSTHHDNDDDDLVIVDERRIPENAGDFMDSDTDPDYEDDPTAVLHVPNAVIPLGRAEQRERRSFENARTPPAVNIRPVQMARTRRRGLRLQRNRNGHWQSASAAAQALPRRTPPRTRHSHMLPFVFDGLFRGGWPALADFMNQEAGDMMGGRIRNDDIDNHIMEMIEQQENTERDQKISKNLHSTDQIKETLEAGLRNLKAPFTSTIDENEEYVCILCGTTLGEGIPDDFRGNFDHKILEKLQEQYDVQAPFQALNLITEGDRVLSKRTFISTCGHTYCGRCVKNISGIRDIIKQKKTDKKFKKTEKSILNPFVYAPLTCVGLDCKTKLGSKRRFNEVYL